MLSSRKLIPGFLLLLLALPLCFSRAAAAVSNAEALFARTNLVAWCIVPFDARKRTPEERALMLESLGLRGLAYDYRAEHVSTFEAEIEALKRHRLELLAWWFPGVYNDEARHILDLLKHHRFRAQLWVSGGGEPTASPSEQQQRVAAESERLRPIALAAAHIGCTVALYNHGGWFGEPENQLTIITNLHSQGITNVGLVYNLHHAHDHLHRFQTLLERMKPHLMALNLNGMTRNGDRVGKKILPLGQGDLDLQLLRVISESGWFGPVGILNHTDADAEARLRDNLEGLEWLTTQLQGRDPSPKPVPRSWQDPNSAAPKYLDPIPPVKLDARPQAAVPENPTPSGPYWSVEDAAAREKLPLYKVIPAASTAELTPANGLPHRKTYRTWHRSHGDNGGTRFSALNQINQSNVTNLQVAWIYHSRDASNNIQCNPIIVGGRLFTPTAGHYMAAVDAETGHELWRFKPEGRPAFRGLTWWVGRDGAPARLMFCAGKYLYALDPESGRPISSFGVEGKVLLPGIAQGEFGAATAAPAVFQEIIVVPGFEKDVWGFDIVTGHHLWTFHTVPHPGEFGYDTWDRPEPYGANCWGGMAMDEARGIAYLTTGSPKPNFIGVNHRGDNLFANCLIALDARTGKRLWHFQEIRHDIWDLDIPAPPNLGTITREGKRVDIVTAVTKIGNTLLLDRVTGKPVFPFRLRRAPASDLRGEQTSPYQPDPELPEPFSKQEYTLADLTDRSEESSEFALTRFKSATTGFFRPCSEGRPNLFFGIDGGAEWTGACIDQDTGRLYVTANHIGWIISLFRNDDPPDNPKAPRTRGREVFEMTCAQCHATNRMGIGMAPPLRGLRHRLTDEQVVHQVRTGKNAMPSHPDMSEADLQALMDFLMLRDCSPEMAKAKPPGERPQYNSSGYPKFYDYEGYPANKPPWGTLNCIDLNTGRLVWKVPLGEYPELTEQGMKITGTENYGGAIVTAGGLVFCAGTRDHKIRAFDKNTGAELWSAKLPWVGSCPPATYEVNGRQYLVITASGGNKLGTPYGDALVAFALP